jgi:hypothetical protein
MEKKMLEEVIAEKLRKNTTHNVRTADSPGNPRQAKR